MAATKRSASASFDDASSSNDEYMTDSFSHPTTNTSDLEYEHIQTRASSILELATQDFQRLNDEVRGTPQIRKTGTARHDELMDVMINLFAGLTASWVRFVVSTRHRRRMLRRLDKEDGYDTGSSEPSTEDEQDRDPTFDEWIQRKYGSAARERAKKAEEERRSNQAQRERKIEGLEDIPPETEAGGKIRAGPPPSANARMNRVLRWCNGLEEIIGTSSSAEAAAQQLQHPYDADVAQRQSRKHIAKRRKVVVDRSGSPVAQHDKHKKPRTPSALRKPSGPRTMPYMKEQAVSYVDLMDEIEQRLSARRAEVSKPTQQQQQKRKHESTTGSTLKRRASEASLEGHEATTKRLAGPNVNAADYLVEDWSKEMEAMMDRMQPKREREQLVDQIEPSGKRRRLD